MTNSIHIDLLGTETRFVESRDYHTRVIEVRNDKPPLILLHGGGGHAETFSRNLNTLAAVCRPIAMDFIWHGMSSRPPFSDGAAGDDVHWLRQFTLQVLDLMAALGLESASFEGESLGGWVALDLAINFPEKVDAIVSPAGCVRRLSIGHYPLYEQLGVPSQVVPIEIDAIGKISESTI